MRKILVLALLLAVALVPASWAMEQGASMFALEIGQGQGDQANPDLGDGYLGLNGDNSTHNSGQIQLGAEYWYMFSSDYALTVSGGIGMYRETEQPAGAGEDLKYTTSSYRVRLGGDRVGQIGDRFSWFMGPGLEYWSGKSKYEVGTDSEETPQVTRYALNGRFGGVMKLGDQIGIVGRIGHSFGIASAEKDGAKTSWWACGFEAMWGLAFSFGGK